MSSHKNMINELEKGGSMCEIFYHNVSHMARYSHHMNESCGEEVLALFRVTLN